MLEPLVLAVNAGSSSLKAAVVDQQGHKHLTFSVENLDKESSVIHSTSIDENRHSHTVTKLVRNGCGYEEALEHILETLNNRGWLSFLVGTGHRVVHGGERFSESVLVDENIFKEIRGLSDLAPLHNPHNLACIQAAMRILPDLPVVAVFDTAFHSTIPAKTRTYALPKSYREAGIRKYGFHGISARYATTEASRILSQLKNPSKKHFNLIICHLDNGASVTAVAYNEPVETSMGFSPLSGLMMDTRSGSIDPAIVSFACHKFHKTVDDVMDDLNKESGLKAMFASDMRTIIHNVDTSPDARLALDMFVRCVVQHIGASLVALPGPVDAIVFTGGIGEHSALIRSYCAKLLQRSVLPKFKLDPVRNREEGVNSDGVLTVEGASPVCLDIPSNEEAVIASDCFEILDRY